MAENETLYNVLVVDDEQQICDLVSIFLMHTGLFESTVTANSASQAMQKMQNQKFDLIIIDFSMPNKSGLEFIHNIKQIFKYVHIKTILISGCLQKGDVLNAVNMGVQSIMVKPFSRDQLISKVCDVLGIQLP